MRITEILGGRLEPAKEGVYSLLNDFSIWTTEAERKLLEKLHSPVKVASLTEHEQFIIQAMIRKSLVTKIGHTNPSVVANEKTK